MYMTCWFRLDSRQPERRSLISSKPTDGHNAGVTTFEALWMGVLVVSLKDRPPLGRFGSTILNSAGLQEWLAEDIDSTVAIAVAKSRDLEYLASVRTSLRQVIADSPICDAKGFSTAVEQAYRVMLQQSASHQKTDKVTG